MFFSSDSQPQIQDVYAVADNILAIRVQAQETIRGQQIPYRTQPGDVINKNGWVKRDGQFIGNLVDQDQTIIRLVDKIYGTPLNTTWANNPENYHVTALGETNFSNINLVTDVFRKSKPVGGQTAEIAPWRYALPITHTIYLELASPLQKGQTYSIDFQGDELADQSYKFRPMADRSEAVHVSHLGFDPGDPTKVAFLSQWMGDGGALEYQPGTPFWLIDEATGQKVYRGKVALSQTQGTPEDLVGRNYNGTDVYIMDFSDFQTPGTYRVAVDGVGTSFNFEIGEKTWEQGFYVTARGFYHQRSGIALEQPYTDYERPRPFHPDDGVKIYQSTVPLMDTSMGLNLKGLNSFDALVNTKTDTLVPDAWGGWFDAGDWDRRIQHLGAVRELLDLASTNPAYFRNLDLNIPESTNGLPDLIDEALWGLDVFKRLQTAEGGIPGGIESAGHPKGYEASWQESQTVMVYGPGIWSSFVYAATAAQAAVLLKSMAPTLANDYRTSALRAMKWAEQRFDPADFDQREHEQVRDWRNLAALELYRATEDKQWHQLFLDTTAFTDPNADVVKWRHYDQEEAAYVYSQLDLPGVREDVQANARQAFLRAAATEIENVERTGFKWQKHAYANVGWGSSMGHPDVTTLLRAHHLTGQDKYLQAGILGLQFTAGANPDNMMFTTQLGERFPADPLVADARATGSAPPPGITVYGPFDYNHYGLQDGAQWAFSHFEQDLYPKIGDWPVTANYVDSYYVTPVTEFTIPQTMAPIAYGFGYLAAFDEHSALSPNTSVETPKQADSNQLESGSVMAIAGSIEGLTHRSQTIVFGDVDGDGAVDVEFENPVVLALPASFNGADMAVPRIGNVTGSSFDVALQETEWLPVQLGGRANPGQHTTETVHYLVVEAGTWLLSDGSRLTADTIQAGESFKAVNFDVPFTETPAVLSQTQSLNDGSFVFTRERHLSPDGFSVKLQSEEARRRLNRSDELIGYLAVDPFGQTHQGNWDGIDFLAGRTGQRFDHSVDADNTLKFETVFDQAPHLLAQIDTYAGGDPAVLRYQNLGTGSVQLKVQEDQTLDAEVFHAPENVSYLALGGSGLFMAERIVA
jgi:endoglucanase